MHFLAVVIAPLLSNLRGSVKTLIPRLRCIAVSMNETRASHARKRVFINRRGKALCSVLGSTAMTTTQRRRRRRAFSLSLFLSLESPSNDNEALSRHASSARCLPFTIFDRRSFSFIDRKSFLKEDSSNHSGNDVRSINMRSSRSGYRLIFAPRSQRFSKELEIVSDPSRRL